MAEQQTTRGPAITAAPFEQPFQTEIFPFGMGGLNLREANDALKVGQFTYLTNLTHNMDRQITVRPGLTALATAGTHHHSVRRLNDPQASTYTRLWGVDQSLYMGQSGALSSVDTGYSGDPLTFLPHRPPLSGDPWMFVADRSRMRKVRADGLDLPIGLPAPATEPTLALGTQAIKTIADFIIGSATDPAVWTPNKGYTYDTPPVQTDLPEILSITTPDSVNNSGIHFGRIASSLRPTGDYVFFGVPTTLDLTVFEDAVTPVTDDDYVHLWLNFSHPNLIEEFRVYIVVAASFSPSVLPGVPDGLGSNTDAYVKSFSASDFAQFFAAQQNQISAAEAARVHAVRDDSLQAQATAQGLNARTRWFRRNDPAVQVTLAQQDPTGNLTVEGAQGADQWHEIGKIGIPLRRGEFQRMGETAGRGWSTVTGLVVMIKTGPNSGPGPVAVRMGNFYLTGGSDPDTGEPGAQPYDYRVTDYDPRTGAESNPSPEMDGADAIDTLRRAIVVTPPAASDSALRQRVYRRGGSLTDDWYFIGTNSSNGGALTDTISDDDAVAAGTVDLDHFQPVPTVDDTGATVLAQPVPVLFGPAAGMIFGLGDPYRPGHLYFCTPDQPDHWSASGNVEICPPSEELMAGFMYGAQPLCFSRSRLYAIYPNLSAGQPVTATTTACTRGIVGRWAWAIGTGGIFGVAPDGIFQTSGGQEAIVSDDIEPLFNGETVNGYLPIDFAFPTAMRLGVWQDELYFTYQDSGGTRRTLVYSILYKFWRPYHWGVSITYLVPDEDASVSVAIVGGLTSGAAYTHAGFSDAGTAISFQLRTGDWDLGRPREDKLLGDQILDADLQNVTVTLQNRLNNGTVVNGIQAIDPGTGRQRYTFDSFGEEPQRARNISTELAGSSSTARPIFYFLGLSVISEPDQTLNRMTQWDDLGHPNEKYVTGITLEYDTGGTARTIIVERDYAGVTSTMATLSCTSTGRHKFEFSWPGMLAHNVRLRPDDDCLAWILYRADWIKVDEPPRIAGWDLHYEADGDQYYTGIDLFCDTGGAEKQIQIEVDGAILTNPYTSEAFWRITANGRRWLHLTFLAGRGHVFHLTALDANPGALYAHKWMLDPEPPEQANWNQNFSAWGIQADKFLKAVVFECDTFGVSKQVQVEADGVVVETLSVNTTGRKVVQIALTTQQLGRIWRLYPADGNPGRLYTAVPVFDVEPYKLDRWQTQETDHDQQGFHSLIDAMITLKSTAAVTLTVSCYINQLGTIVSDPYTIPSTLGVKDKKFVPFKARKGVLYAYVFTSPEDFFLYREESQVRVQPSNGGAVVTVHPFGNDDQDRTRGMTNAQLAAARSGGGA